MQVRSSGSVRIFSLDRAKLLDRLRVAAEQLAAAHPEVEEVWLFGSLARGDARPGSDADVLVILTESALPFHERSPRYRLASCGIGVDLLLYTRAEFDNLPTSAPRFAAAVAADRLLLYGPSPAEVGEAG